MNMHVRDTIIKNKRWQAQFATGSREDAVKVSAILADGMISACQARQHIRILVLGGAMGGKSLLVDAMTYRLADTLSPYDMPLRSSYEKNPCDAVGRYLMQHFQQGAHGLTCALTRQSDNWLSDTMVHARRAFHKISNPGRPLIEFETDMGNRIDDYTFDCVIKFDRRERKNLASWDRLWRVGVNDGPLQNNDMMQSLDNINRFYKRRYNRLVLSRKIT